MPPSAVAETPHRAGAWWVQAFGPQYLSVYGHRDEAEATRNAPTIARLVKLKPGSRVLDIACGEGRYARALTAYGCRVTGIDLSADLLDEARRQSPLLPGTPTYLRCDMRELPFSLQFEAAVSLFTSFGYFDERTDDARVLEGIERALVPGGRFLIDFLNAVEVRAHLVAESEQVRGPFHVKLSRRIDDESPAGPFVRKHVVVTDARTGEVVSDVEERVRLYLPEELDAALLAAGLEPVDKPLGDFDGRPYSPDSPRFIRTAMKTGRSRVG